MQTTASVLSSNEKLRYVLAGVWNSFVGWGAFALTWMALGSMLNLWAVSAVAHAIATTHAFFVQRNLVFREKTQPIQVQFVKFQIAYLIMLVVGALFVNALSVQGVHPMLAQFLGMLLLALTGYVVGKSFTFNPAALQMRALVRRLLWTLGAHRMTLACFLASLAIFEFCWGSRFYTDPLGIGHDFALAATTLLEGKYWIDSNGPLVGLFIPPWFTPAWCAGAAFYADPQSAFYSPLQLFALWMDPFSATHVNTLLFAGVAYWGGYALARKILGWGIPAAIVFGAIGMAHGFLPLRSAVGEAGYQPFYLWTLLALALCWNGAGHWFRRLAWPSIGVALCLTAWLQFGFAGMMVPAFLATLMLCLGLIMFGRADLWFVLGRAMLGGVLAIALNASKLYESLSLMKSFPRDFYEMPGFPLISDAFAAIVFALVQPSEWTAFFGMRKLTDVQFTVLPHEWALNFGFGTTAMALLAGAVLLSWRRKPAGPSTLSPRHWTQWLSFFGIVALGIIPLLLLWNNGGLRMLIKQVPILNSAAWPMRWIVLYVPLLQLVLALPMNGILARARGAAIPVIVALALSLIWLGPISEPQGYYLDRDAQGYNPTPVRRAFEQSRVADPPVIDQISMAGGGISRNDTMLDGASQVFCYNPLYGYGLESFPQMDRMREGPALSADENGQTLISNPACLVHPAENGCEPGSGFDLSQAEQRAQAEKFVSRRPLDWKRPVQGRVFSWLSQSCFWLLLALVALRAWQLLMSLALPDPNRGVGGSAV